MSRAAEERLVAELADGRSRSYAVLAARLGTSRHAVDGRLRALGDFGLSVERLDASRVRLARPLFLLDVDVIRGHLGDTARDRLDRLDLELIVESTSERLLQKPVRVPGRASACLAEFQTGGRARRGKRWIAPLGAGICLSVGWCFARMPDRIGALSLATGVVVRGVLTRLGVDGIGLKWPNDVVVGDTKLGGILIDAHGAAGGPCQVVVGVGLNHTLPKDAPRDIAALGGNAVDIVSLMPSGAPGRNLIAGRLISALVDLLAGFDDTGFDPYRASWDEADCLRGRDIVVHLPNREVQGVARGIAEDGALEVDVDGRAERFVAGDVSVRQTGAAARRRR